MSIRTIRTGDEPCLHKKCRPVTDFDAKLHTLLDDLVDTMRDKEGVGLAAPQVGILRRVAVIDVEDGNGVYELVNPRIISSDGCQGGMEGCLSFPGETGYVERPNHVVVEAYDRNGDLWCYEGEGLFARAVFHEYDHLAGEVYLRLVTEPPPDWKEESEEEA
ncbi:MAG: peptide deformylase [Clostridiales bacterium]|nr:peptide deformylase [Clostridiales bacterium]